MHGSSDSLFSGRLAAHTIPKPQNRELVSASLRMLAMRDMSRLQFVQKLKAKSFTPDEIASAATWCEAEGWLNEARYADVMARRLGQKYGVSRITLALRQKGVNDLAITETVAALQDSEISRAHDVWSRRYEVTPNSAEERAKQTRYLQSRGFSFAAIKQVLSGRMAQD